jgi:hypothetical protein
LTGIPGSRQWSDCIVIAGKEKSQLEQTVPIITMEGQTEGEEEWLYKAEVISY